MQWSFPTLPPRFKHMGDLNFNSIEFSGFKTDDVLSIVLTTIYWIYQSEYSMSVITPKVDKYIINPIICS